MSNRGDRIFEKIRAVLEEENVFVTDDMKEHISSLSDVITEDDPADEGDDEEVDEPEMHSYHFDVGNSNDGPLGLCAVIVESTKERALTLLQEVLPEEVELVSLIGSDNRSDSEESEPGVVYINVYLNEKLITIADIDIIDDADVVDETPIDAADENGNENCLKGIACPNCPNYSNFWIEANAKFRVYDDGTDEGKEVEWDDKSRIECTSCGHAGTVAEFKRKPKNVGPDSSDLR